jgi:hypothetical protein
MKKILIVNSYFDDARQMSLAAELALIIATPLREARIRGEIEIQAIQKNFRDLYPREVLPRDYDAYLLHPGDVHFEDVRRLKQEKPQAVLYCTNRDKKDVDRSYREIFDEFLFWVGDEEARAIAKRLGVRADD